MRRFALVVIPILAAATALIGVYFVLVGVRMIVAGRDLVISLAFGAFGGVGFILAFALWSIRRQILTRLGEPPA
jgi:hypothetical protein